MSQTTIFVYPSEEDKRRDEFLTFFAQTANWDLQKTSAYFNESNPKSNIFIKGIDSNRAPEIIDEFYKLGVAASIFMLEPAYQKKFFDIRDGKKIQWNWFSAIFNWAWYLFKGLGLKTIILLLASIILSAGLNWIAPGIGNLLAWILTLIYAGLFGSYDYYLAKTKNEKLWPHFPSKCWGKPLTLTVTVIFIVLASIGIRDISNASKKLALFSKDKPALISQYDSKSYSFSKIPASWNVSVDIPKVRFINLGMTIARKAAGNGSLTLKYDLSEGADLFAIQNPLDGNKETGQDGIIVVKSQSTKLKDLHDNAIEKYLILDSTSKIPFFMRWFGVFPKTSVITAYSQIGEREWIEQYLVQEISLGEFKSKFHFRTYSILAGTRLITVLVESFDETDQTVRSQTIEFLKSFVEK